MKLLYHSTPLEIKIHRYSEFQDNMPEHAHDFLTISLLLEGEVLEQSEGAMAVANGCQVSIKPAGVLHSDVFTKDSTIVALKVNDPQWFGIDLQEWKWVWNKDSLALFSGLLREENKKSAFQVLSNHLQTASEKDSTRLSWLEKVHSVVCQNYRDNLSVSDLAKSAGKHPVYLTRAFKKRYGADIKSYQANLRLGYAISERVNRGVSLTEIAHDTGFSDQSHFNRTFKNVLGHSPKQVLSDFEV